MGARTRGRVKRLALSILAGLSLAIATAAPAIANFTIMELGVLGDNISEPRGINDAGQVVGRSFTSTGVSRAFLWEGHSMTDLNSLIPADSGWVLEVATGINQVGQIVGLGTFGGTQRAFLWQNGQVTDLGALGGLSSRAFAINNLGDVVGCYAIGSNGAEHAFVWRKGTMTDLNSLIPTDSGWVLECAAAINDAGQIVGVSTVGQRRAFVWQDGQVTDLGTWRYWNGASDSRGINNIGQVVGAAVDFVFQSPEGEGGDPIVFEVWRAFLWQSGTISDLGMLGMSLTAGAIATAINDTGYVVGFSFVPDDPSSIRAFLWTSVGGMADLNNLIPPNEGWHLEGAYAINQAGQIVGTGLHNGQARAFLLTPPPKPPDVAAPTWVNGTLTASGLTSTSATLTWRGAQDDVAVTGYRLFVNGSLYGTPAAPPATIGGLTSATRYAFKVEGCDAAMNCSTTGPALTVTTPKPPDVAAPTWVTGTLTATGLTSTSATLTWRGAQDDVAVTGYRLFVNGALYITPAASAATVGGLAPGTIYAFKVEACDAATNCSTTGPALTVTTPPPLVPNLVIAALSAAPNSALRLGARFDVTDTVENAGTGPAGGSTTRYYLSTDGTRSGDDRPLAGSRTVSAVAAGARSAGTATVTIPGGTPPGRYVLLACADDLQAVAESDEADNCRASAGTVKVR
jgi:probable HAF family extracellular repeat protein